MSAADNAPDADMSICPECGCTSYRCDCATVPEMNTTDNAPGDRCSFCRYRRDQHGLGSLAWRLVMCFQFEEPASRKPPHR